MMQRLQRTVVLCGIAAVIAGIGLVQPASAGSDRTGRKERKVTFTTASGPPVPFAQTCDSAGACLVPISGGPESTITGDFEGTGVYAGAARLLGTDEAYSSAVATFTGSVQGCGEGTNTIRYDADYSADLPHGGGGTWEIVDGLGTGDLKRLNGKGTFRVGEVNPSDFSGTNLFKGTIRC